MVRWLLRKGTTRSHSELGRETLLRQWYFSLSCGRVGHCRTFYTLVPYTSYFALSPPLPSLPSTSCRGFLFFGFFDELCCSCVSLTWLKEIAFICVFKCFFVGMSVMSLLDDVFVLYGFVSCIK